MSTLQKWVVGIVAIGAITALTLPGRQTVPVIKAGTGFFTKSESTAITGKSA